MEQAEIRIQRRIWLLLLNLGAYAVWQGAQLSFIAKLPHATPASLIGALVWFITLVMALQPLLNARARAAWKHDERMAHNRLMAIAAGFWALVLGVATAAPIAFWFAATTLDIVRLLAIIAVAGPVIAFAALEGRDGRDS
jgi:hypothetical protein